MVKSNGGRGVLDLIAIYTGIVVRFGTQFLRSSMLGPGQLVFPLQYGECIVEIRFNQDENVLKAFQIVLSSGRTSEIYRFDQTTPLTMRYGSVGWSVGRLVGRSVGRSVGRLVGNKTT